MSRKQKEPLRSLTAPEREQLQQIARAQSWPAVQVARAKALLAVADGTNSVKAAQAAGRKSGDAVSHLVARFNHEGVRSVIPIHRGGPTPLYGPKQREYILAQARRQPDRERDGTATWSLKCLQQALRQELPGNSPLKFSTYTIWCILHEAGLSWQKSRTWCQTGSVLRQRNEGSIIVTDADAEAKKKLIEESYLLSEGQGLTVCNEDEAGPFQSIPQPGSSWQPCEQAARQPHEYIRAGTAKLLTLFHPASGQVRVQGVTSSSNRILHPWMQEELTQMLSTFPLPDEEQSEERQEQSEERHPQRQGQWSHWQWSHWQRGLTEKFTLAQQLPPLRMLLILDNLAGHMSASFVCWLMAHGIMPLYTPIGGSWLNMAEIIQRILVRRALSGQHPSGPTEAIAWLGMTAARRQAPGQCSSRRFLQAGRRRPGWFRRFSETRVARASHTAIPGGMVLE
jgi:transposase